MTILRDKTGRANIRLIVLVFAVLSGIAAALLYFPPVPTRTEPEKTSGDITFTDSSGIPLGGTISISIAGELQRPQENANFISWTNVPDARIHYSALETKNIAINFRMSGNSPKSKVILENYGVNQPGNVNISAPQVPIRYVEISPIGVSFAEAEIFIRYTDAELYGLNETRLVIYRYDNVTRSWIELPTTLDASSNIVSTTVNSLSVFAVSARTPEKIEVWDTKKIPVISDINTYDDAKNLKKAKKTSVLSTTDVPERGELEVDALTSKNVAVKFKLESAGGGEIILDDFGKNNPVSVPLPGRAVKYVEIGVRNISFSFANITIRYSESELNGVNEDDLRIYHWNAAVASWEPLPTIVDSTNKTLTATATSLSPLGVGGNVVYRWIQNTGTTVATGVTTSWTSCGLNPTSDIITLINTSAGGCTSDSLQNNRATRKVEMYYNTAYTVDTVVTGNWYFGRVFENNRNVGTLKLELIYVHPNGTVVNLSGSVTKSISKNFNQNINESLSAISGTVPTGAKLGMRITASGDSEIWVYFGTTAGIGSVESGYFSINDAPVQSATYTISGYVVNALSGAVLSGALIQTNTSLNTTTNEAGFYNLTGLSNGIYIINATLAGYNTNSTTKTVSGANITNANISLSPVPAYTLSGYVTNSSSGLPLSGATVQTNTSLTTTTNATGFYNFTGLSNGTYIVNASLADYITNFTSMTINGADINNVNISLSPMPTYLLSGYVTSAIGLPLSGAAVQTNTSLTTTTNATGFYSFYMSNGTYAVNASLAGYVTNATIVTINGASVANANISLSPTTYVLSGYVFNTSGLPLNGATVQTNTSLTTTTNATGFYNFTGISNGTYIINASLTGYVTNSTTVTISTANVTNANITLSPPTYLLSGYVTNISGGAAISGATVTTNTSLTNTTDTSGFYSFEVNNGSYQITASKTGYSSNSTTKTVNGANVANSNISLTPAPAAGVAGAQLLKVVTNRFVILDDPSGWDGGFGGTISNTGNQWSGENTRVRWYVLAMNSSSRAAQSVTVTSKLYFPNGTLALTQTNTTNSIGVAEFELNMDRWLRYNGSSSEGIYTINATATVESINVTGNYSFTYDEWGCGSSGSGCHRSQYWGTSNTVDSQNITDRRPNWVSGSVQNSPYLHAWDNFHSTNGHPTKQSFNSGECLTCHRGYDGVYRSAHNTRITFTPQYAAGIHAGKSGARCIDCHRDFGFSETAGGMPIKTCYECHPQKNNNLTVKNFSQAATSGFSYQPLTNSSIRAHNAGQQVPCIICHNGMHDVSKPHNITANTNSYTEYTQCTICHSAKSRHNDSVSCTVCHSQDAHVIKVLAQNGSYTIGVTSSSRGNCTNCHQNSTYFNTLLSRQYAGAHSGNNPPRLPAILNHSDDPIAGRKWNSTPGYWTNTSPVTACNFCHGDTKHQTTALGSVAQFRGGNLVNQSTSTSRWCQQCHYQGGTNYNDMVTTFTNEGKKIPPENTGNATYGNLANSTDGKTLYYNHSGFTSYNDSKCSECHGRNAADTNITSFLHNVAEGGGGPNCISCHDYGKTGSPKRINATDMLGGMHANLNSNATSDVPAENKKCWACHSNGTQPSGRSMGIRYNDPFKCYDCHNATAKPYPYANSAPNVSEHFVNGTDIKAAKNATSNSSACIVCHNLSEMKVNYTEDDTYRTNFSQPSHYGKSRRNDSNVRRGAMTNCSYCHQNASTVFVAAMLDSNNSLRPNHSTRYSSSPYCTECHNSGWLHNDTLTKPVLNLPNSSFCLGCHGLNATTGGTNFSGMVTGTRRPHNDSVNCTDCHLNISRDIHPVKFLQPNGSYNIDNSTAVNCINCHQNTTVYPNLTRTPPKIPNPLYHSNTPSNGTLWNSTGYWNNNSPITMCIYCHNDSKHSASALGRLANWKGDNGANSSITSSSTWCAGCHYQGYSSGGKNYANMTQSFTSANLPVPPEITNGTYAPYTFPRYLNHSLRNYTDAACRACHGINLTPGDYIKAFVHNITWGGCKDCHFSFIAMNTTIRPQRYVNSTMFDAGPHRPLACQNCHTKGHKNIGARKACEDCHAVQQNPITDRNRHNITRDPWNNKISGISAVNITDCTTCHDAAPYSNATSNYGYNKTRDCDYCHTYPDKTYS